MALLAISNWQSWIVISSLLRQNYAKASGKFNLVYMHYIAEWCSSMQCSAVEWNAMKFSEVQKCKGCFSGPLTLVYGLGLGCTQNYSASCTIHWPLCTPHYNSLLNIYQYSLTLYLTLCYEHVTLFSEPFKLYTSHLILYYEENLLINTSHYILSTLHCTALWSE